MPNFFDYDKKFEVVKNHLVENYNLEISEHAKIDFKFFPLPNLEITNLVLNLDEPSTKIKTENLIIVPQFLSLYNFENFQIKKIVLKNNSSTVEIFILYDFIKKILQQKNKLSVENLDIHLEDKKKLILKLNDIHLTNFGYNKNLVLGKIFGKKFKIDINNEFKKINFKIINSGIAATINFNRIKDSLKKGSFKSKILNTNLKFNFSFDNKMLNINNLFLRNKNIYFKNNSSILFEPYLEINSKFYMEELNTHILKNINFDQLVKFKDIIKKINSKNEIEYNSNKLSRTFIDNLNLKIVLAYGRINYMKQFSIKGGNLKCKGNINLLDEFPLLFFNCSIFSKDKKKLLKEFSIKTKKEQEPLNIKFEGNLNILNNKINLKNIMINDDYVASKNDLKYFKDSFEAVFFKKNFFEIFNLKKVKLFVLEVS